MKRAILVGAGGMGQTWAKNVIAHDEVELAAWVDVREGAAKEAALAHGLPNLKTYTLLSDAIEAGGADFVIDVTIPEAHCDVTTTALAAGLPVLGEKPMAASLEQARKMVAASEAAGKLYMVSQSRRYNGGIKAFRHMASSLGSLGILNADFYIGAHFGGFRDEMASPLVLDMAIHTFDAARFISGADPVSVYAEEFNPGWSWYKGDACANAIFEMSDGLRFCYRGSWCTEGAMTSWESSWRVVGEHGTALWDGHGEPHGEIVEQRGGFHSQYRTIQEPRAQIREGIAGSLDEFLHALETGETPNGECHDNIKSLEMVFMALESSRQGRRVSLVDIG